MKFNLAETKIETLLLYIAMISIVGIVLILVLKELDIFTGDLTDTIGSLPQKLGSGLGKGLGALVGYGWLWGTGSN